MEKLARSAALVSVLLTGAALAAAPAEAAQYRFLNGQFQNQNFVDNCPGNPRPAACRPKKPAAVKPLPYFKPPAYVLSGQYKTHPQADRLYRSALPIELGSRLSHQLAGHRPHALG